MAHWNFPEEQSACCNHHVPILPQKILFLIKTEAEGLVWPWKCVVLLEWRMAMAFLLFMGDRDSQGICSPHRPL